MVTLKKYVNFSGRKIKEVAIIFIISIIVIIDVCFFIFNIIQKGISEIAYLNNKNNVR